MDIRDIVRFSREEVRYQDNIYAEHNSDSYRNVLGRTVKLGEEVGEFNDVVLSYLGLQRKEKLDNFNFQKVGEEASDIIIALINLCVVMDVDIEEALLRNMEKLKERREN